jgi:hypothetical protein
MRQQNLISTWMGVMVMAGLVLSVHDASAQRASGDRDLQAMAREANTVGEHAAVARQFRLEGEAFAAKAAEHEANAARLARSAGPMLHKWPSMAPRTLQIEKDRAVAARRSSEESFRLADQHLRMSVEALATSQPGSQHPSTR